MAVEIFETFGSQAGKDATGKNSGRTRTYQVSGTNDDATIMATVLGTAPPESFGGLVLDDISKQQLGPGLWQCTANYIDPEKQEEKKKIPTGEVVASFDTTGGTQHVTVSLETTGSAARSGSLTPPDFQKAIEVTESGVNGTDIVVPQLHFELQYKFPNASITDAYIRKLRDLTGTTNDAKWKGWERGDLLFLGASGRQSSQGDVEVTFSFAAGKEIEDDFGMASDLTKRAHDHIWFYFTKEDDATAERIVHKPTYAYVERLYEESDFGDLGIGS